MMKGYLGYSTIKQSPVATKPVVYLEKAYSQNAINFYVVALFICNAIFFNRVLNPMFWVSGIIEVYCFFHFSKQLTRKWQNFTEKKFLKKLFRSAIFIRLGWVVFSYFFFKMINGNPFEWGSADSKGYDKEAGWLADMISEGNLKPFFDYKKGSFSDMGYGLFLGYQYWITGKSILIARLLKTIYSAYTCVLIYQLARRNFGEGVGRIAGIFCMLMPNMILYSGLQLKEAEMVFLTVAFMERADKLIRGKKFSFSTLFLPIILALSLFFFRTVLGITVLFAFLSTLLLTKDKILGAGKRVILIVWVLLAVGYFIGGRIATEVEGVWKQRQSQQQSSMDFRATRDNGNKYAKYLGGAVFAPIIFVIPFPTIVNTPDQENQQFMNGGNYVKNILAFFVILSLYYFIKEWKWRDHLLIISFTIGYAIVLAFSPFAQAERFHQPVLPFELLLAAYGLSRVTKKQKKLFQTWLIFIFAVMVFWSWFKLSGRGLA